MAKVRKIKRDQLAELGDEFDVLSDDDIRESGIDVSADEVLVVAKPAPTQPQGGDGNSDEVGTLRNRLHTVNQESAERRLKIKDYEGQLATLRNELTTLKQTEADRKLAETKSNAKALLMEYAKDKKYEFVSAEASDDVAEIVLNGIDWTQPVTKEVVGPKVDDIITKRKYVLKTPALGGTDGGRQSAAGVEDAIDVDLTQIAKEFGIPDYKPTEGVK